MNALTLHGIGVCAGGMADWPAARAVLRRDAAFIAQSAPRLSSSALPATERRRANDTARWALQTAAEAVQGLAPEEIAGLATVFASADGDGEVLAQVLHDLAAEKVTLSPTTFHNSVFNAPAGYWSIAAHVPAASTTVCAGEGSFAAGLLEAAAQVTATGAPVLLIAYDLPFPARSPIATAARAAFSCAMKLAPRDAAGGAVGRIARMTLTREPPSPLPDALDACFAGNAAAIALVLLDAVAREGAARVSLPYLDGESLAVEWTP